LLRKSFVERSADRIFAVGVARAFGGAIIFSLPLLMTMEMWWLGFAMDRLRLALLVVLLLPVLIGLSYFSGFEKTMQMKHDVVDALVAYAVGFISSAIVLLLFGVLEEPSEAVGQIALQAVPASFGALLAQSQLGSGEQKRKRDARYAGSMFLMGAGALFLAFNVAPTEEMVLIAQKMSAAHAVAMSLVSIAVIHAFVYALEFQGTKEIPPGTPFHSLFLRFSVTGYAVALLVSAYVLWTFGRFEGQSPGSSVAATIVLGFPAAIGAAAARLIL
jgi:putative integral membrane protein (TIGR02587 family)